MVYSELLSFPIYQVLESAVINGKKWCFICKFGMLDIKLYLWFNWKKKIPWYKLYTWLSAYCCMSYYLVNLKIKLMQHGKTNVSVTLFFLTILE